MAPTMREIPSTGMGHYLRDAVYGAGDGVVTTFAIIAGTTGAGLGAFTAIALGLANRVADGISMGAGNYLALKSQLEQADASVEDEAPHRHGLAAFAAFVLAGAMPLAAYALPTTRTFVAASWLAAATLFLVGSLRSSFLGRAWWRCGLEMLLIGGIAGGAAYAIGVAAAWWM